MNRLRGIIWRAFKRRTSVAVGTGTGQWDFALAAQSGHLLTAGIL